MNEWMNVNDGIGLRIEFVWRLGSSCGDVEEWCYLRLR